VHCNRKHPFGDAGVERIAAWPSRLKAPSARGGSILVGVDQEGQVPELPLDEASAKAGRATPRTACQSRAGAWTATALATPGSEGNIYGDASWAREVNAMADGARSRGSDGE
jgi:hypothetical protein